MSQSHFDPVTFLDQMHAEVPHYEEVQEYIAGATESIGATAILDLGSGTGETLFRVLARHPTARAIGVDELGDMLDTARSRLAEYQVVFHEADLMDLLPEGPFDLVVSALAVHHLDGPQKAELFRRVAAVLRPGGRFVLGDVVVPDDPSGSVIPLSEGYDKPSTVAEQVGWLEEAGFTTTVLWREDDIAVFTADRPGTS